MALKKKLEITEGTGIFADYLRVSRSKYEKDIVNGMFNFYLDVFMDKAHADSGKKPMTQIPMSAPFSELGVENPMMIVDWEKVPALYEWIKTKYTVRATRVVKKMVDEKSTQKVADLTESQISEAWWSQEKFEEWKTLNGSPEEVNLIRPVERDVEEGYDLAFFNDSENV